jgi:hypothetical protein
MQAYNSYLSGSIFSEVNFALWAFSEVRIAPLHYPVRVLWPLTLLPQMLVSVVTLISSITLEEGMGPSMRSKGL